MQFGHQTLSIAMRSLREKTWVQRATVDLDTYYTQVKLISTFIITSFPFIYSIILIVWSLNLTNYIKQEYVEAHIGLKTSWQMYI